MHAISQQWLLIAAHKVFFLFFFLFYTSLPSCASLFKTSFRVNFKLCGFGIFLLLFISIIVDFDLSNFPLNTSKRNNRFYSRRLSWLKSFFFSFFLLSSSKFVSSFLFLGFESKFIWKTINTSRRSNRRSKKKNLFQKELKRNESKTMCWN